MKIKIKVTYEEEPDKPLEDVIDLDEVGPGYKYTTDILDDIILDIEVTDE